MNWWSGNIGNRTRRRRATTTTVVTALTISILWFPFTGSGNRHRRSPFSGSFPSLLAFSFVPFHAASRIRTLFSFFVADFLPNGCSSAEWEENGRVALSPSGQSLWSALLTEEVLYSQRQCPPKLQNPTRYPNRGKYSTFPHSYITFFFSL